MEFSSHPEEYDFKTEIMNMIRKFMNIQALMCAPLMRYLTSLKIHYEVSKQVSDGSSFSQAIIYLGSVLVNYGLVSATTEAYKCTIQVVTSVSLSNYYIIIVSEYI